ncbi:extracellular solute-binding protein [Clostridiales bacterium COT073_COT-073]|nr:extracellular solute-binding protein [Clostridiales bacterium COT073_COT-073]
MKKWGKKLTALLLAAAMAGSLAACGGDTKKAEQRPTLRWLTTGDTAAKPMEENDRVIKAIEDKLGIDLVVEVVPEASVEKVNVAMASGTLPDIVTGAFGTSATQQWIQDGMVIALDDYLKNAPALAKRLNDDYGWDLVDGKHYGVPFINQLNSANSLIVFREDWLKKLNLKYPETLEEMKETLIAFTKNDPDGDGKDNTYGYTAVKPSSGGNPFEWVFFAYGIPYADYSLDKDGNVIPWFEDPAYIPAMKYIKELWDAGVVDPEIMLNTNPKKEEKFYQGKAGSMLAALFRHVNRIEGNLKQLFPEAAIAYGMAPKGPEGKFGLSKQGKSGMYTCVTKACKAPEKAVALIDFLLSEEGKNLVRLGIEGVHYKKDGDKIVINEEERAKDAFSPNGWAHAMAWGIFFWPLESSYLPDSEPARDRAIESVDLATACQVKNLVPVRTPLEVKNGGMLGDMVVQYFSDMLQGKIEIEAGVKKLSEEWRKQGGEEMLKELNAEYQKKK